MALKLKKETMIIIFYILYFSWLFTVTYLSPATMQINYFTLFVIFFYFIFLKEEWDIIWFIVASSLALIGKTSFFANIGEKSFDQINQIPFWLPLAWGTTVLALRKFFIVVTNR
jgi:hypothetical protein